FRLLPSGSNDRPSADNIPELPANNVVHHLHQNGSCHMDIQTSTQFGACACQEHVKSTSSAIACEAAVSHEDVKSAHPSRRRFLQTVTLGTVAGILGGTDLAHVRSAHAADATTVFTPETALKELMDGNKRYRAINLTGCRQDLAVLQQKTMEKQEPF